MISTRDQAIKIYRMLRPNGGASEGEIVGTVGKRTFASFLNDAQAEIAMRDGNIAAQAKALAEAQAAINSLSDRPTKEEYARVQAIVTDKNAEVGRLQKALDAEIKNIKTEYVEVVKEVTKEVEKPYTNDGVLNWLKANVGPFVKHLISKLRSK